MITITRIFEFSAGHHLPHHEGLCRSTHGHNYKLEVEITNNHLKQRGGAKGMVMDFADLKVLVNDTIVSVLDHTNLNKIYDNPTAEIMVLSISTKLQDELKYKAKLVRVRLWETSNSYAEWRA